MTVIRFGVVGALNTLVDFSVLNLLLVVFAVKGSIPLLVCNATSFTVANLNSYLFNKRWTFGDHRRGTLGQFLLFVFFSLGGLAVNSLILFVGTFFIPTPDTSRHLLWINSAKVLATGGSMVWNFFCYRQFVFRFSPKDVPGGDRRTTGLGRSGSSPTGDSPLAGPNKK